ncbi:MAG TPA: nitrite reductase small subunit NirD [Steroidobacteraceae bacterium]|nr:nitrite reductase small subunit NirD [Steroidobacteraceae bacterium]
MSAARWTHVCALEDIYPDSGVCALIEGRQVALFRVADGIHAIGNHDPVSGANVLARGIVGDSEGEPVVASPLYKQHFSLVTGRCLEEPEHHVPVYLARISAGEVWVRAQPVSIRAATAVRRLVVIGNGVAAMRTLEELVSLAPRAYAITVFGAEPHAPYNRVLLSPLLAGDRSSEELVTHTTEWFAQHGITQHLGDPVESIDRVRRRVRAASGAEVPYDRLLIATGSRPRLPSVPGIDLPGVVAFRDLSDVEAMLAVARPGQPAVVIGGGLLGVEAAAALAQRGMAVTVVHAGEFLMNRQLDNHASALVRAELEGRGIGFRLAAQTESIEGDGRVSGVRLTGGARLAATLVVTATGVRPNIDLARAAGLRCDRGILVNDTLQTYDPAIYAVGECVQHRNSTYGVVAPLWDQARVCAAYLAERGVRRYGGSRVSAQLKVSGIQVFSAGDCSGGASRESLVMRDPKRGIYKHLVLEGGRIRGAVLYGDTADSGWYLDLINEGRDVGAMREQLLFGASPTVSGACG